MAWLAYMYFHTFFLVSQTTDLTGSLSANFLFYFVSNQTDRAIYLKAIDHLIETRNICLTRYKLKSLTILNVFMEISKFNNRKMSIFLLLNFERNEELFFRK